MNDQLGMSNEFNPTEEIPNSLPQPEMEKPIAPAAETRSENTDTEKLAVLTTSLHEDTARLADVRAQLGLEANAGNAPALENREAELAALREKLQGTVSEEFAPEILRFNEEARPIFRRMQNEVADFADALSRGGFQRLTLMSDELEKATPHGTVDVGAADEQLLGLYQALGKRFMPEDDGKKMAIAAKSFTPVIDALDKLAATTLSLRKTFEGVGIASTAKHKDVIELLGKLRKRIREKQEGFEEVKRAKKKLE